MYDTSNGGGGFLWGFVIIYLVLLVLVIIAAWRVFEKAGKPGWACLIPFYNIYVVLQIVGRPGWWLVLYFVPLVNIVIWVIVAIDLSKSFGLTPWFALGLLLLPIIFYPILGFGDARYLGPAALGPVAPPAAAPQVPPTWTPPAVPPPPPTPSGSGG